MSALIEILTCGLLLAAVGLAVSRYRVRRVRRLVRQDARDTLMLLRRASLSADPETRAQAEGLADRVRWDCRSIDLPLHIIGTSEIQLTALCSRAADGPEVRPRSDVTARLAALGSRSVRSLPAESGSQTVTAPAHVLILPPLESTGPARSSLHLPTETGSGRPNGQEPSLTDWPSRRVQPELELDHRSAAERYFETFDQPITRKTTEPVYDSDIDPAAGEIDLADELSCRRIQQDIADCLKSMATGNEIELDPAAASSEPLELDLGWQKHRTVLVPSGMSIARVGRSAHKLGN